MFTSIRFAIWLLGALIFLSNHTFSQTANDTITLEKIWKSGEFSGKYISGISSMSDGIHYTSLTRSRKGMSIVKYRYKDGVAVDTLFDGAMFKSEAGNPITFSSYSFNPDESKLLLATDEESIYRRSSKANYFAVDITTGKSKPVTDFEKGKQELAAFSPVANKVAFVRANNLYISDLDTGTESQLTKDGLKNHIINGAVDWVYEEEFGFHEGFAWSPNGTKIAFYRFDESEVPEFDMAMYTGLYPSEYRFKYPKAGEKNAEVRIMVYDLASGTTSEAQINANPEQYIPRIKWTQDDDKLSIMRMNRLQNKLEFLLANTTETAGGRIPTRPFYTETSETYIDINDNLIFLDDGSHFMWNSERDGYNHLYLFPMKGGEGTQITQGDWEVVTFYGLDQDSKTAFFSAALESPIEEAVYSVPYKNALKGKTTSRPAKLTQNRNSNSASFSNGCKYFINSESGASLPYQYALFDAKGEKIRDLELNEALVERIKKYDLPTKEFGSFSTEAGYSLNYSIIKPRDFDPDKIYPLMFMVYGGPGHNTVTNGWDGAIFFWHQLLAQEGMIVVSVDPRGTMFRGRDFKHSTYMDLGRLEVEDMIASAKHFGALPYVDAERIGVMGWSYGGYLSSLCLTKGADYFKLGIAVAPVTNWRYYDTIYTERFLRTPQENPKGYDENSPINFVDMMKGKYLLVHGSADDNVHYQNTMEMIKALVEADKQFDLFIYPNKNHGIYGGNTRYHLYTKMTDFIISEL